MTRTPIIFGCVLLFAASAIAEEAGDVVVRQATGAALVDGSELPRAGIGLWRLETGSTLESKGGFVELELQEGVWLRLRDDTLVKLAAESEQALEIELHRGAVVLDALRKPEKEVRLKLGNAALNPDGKGSFLAEAQPARFASLKGKAEVETGGQKAVLKSKMAMPAVGSSGAEKLAKLDEDAFETWREERNEEFEAEMRRADTFAERTIRPAR